MMKNLTISFLGALGLLLCGCSHANRTDGNNGMENADTLCTDPPFGYVVELKPLGNFSHKKTETLRIEFIKQLHTIFFVSQKDLENSVYVGEKEKIPSSCFYKPKNRYWAGKILDMIHTEHGWNNEIVTIGLTNRDISTSARGHYNYGILGLSYKPGDVCLVSTYRMKCKDDLWKVTMHEFLHSRGLPHCPKDNPQCLMQDGHGKNTFYMKHGLCPDCKEDII